MSWISENYEKAALGASVVVALGIGLVIVTGGAEDGDEIRNPSEVNEYTVAQSDGLIKLKEVMDAPQGWEFEQHNKSDLTSFVGFPLYGIKGKAGIHELDPDTSFDEIPLSWWKEFELDGYQFADAGAKDADKDGFSNKEEYLAKTSPIDVDDHPDLITKLQFVKALPPKGFRIQWSRLDDNRGSFTFKEGNNPSSLDLAGVGDSFPADPRDESYKNRFKITEKGSGKNPANSIDEDFYVIEDQKPSKNKQTYKLWYSDRSVYYDWAAEFKLDTPDGGEPFVVQEGEEFSLPYKEGGTGYKLVAEKREGTEFGDPKIEMTVGETKKVITLGETPEEPEAELDTGSGDGIDLFKTE